MSFELLVAVVLLNPAVVVFPPIVPLPIVTGESWLVLDGLILDPITNLGSMSENPSIQNTVTCPGETRLPVGYSSVRRRQVDWRVHSWGHHFHAAIPI
jgi:hypothetical protein